MVHHLMTHTLFGHTLAIRGKELLKLKNTIITCLIRFKIILYHFLSLNTFECLICQIYQKNRNREKIIHISI